MANSINFNPLNEADLVKSLGKAKSFESKYPKKDISSSELKSKLKGWQNGIVPDADKVILSNIKASAIVAKDVESIRAINESPTPTAEAIIVQKMNPEKVLGTLYTSLCTLEFTKMESEFKNRLKAATTPAAKALVQTQWDNGVKQAIQVFSSAGLKGLKESDLKKFSQELSVNKANFNSIVNIANTGVAVAGTTVSKLKSTTVLKSGFVPVSGLLIDKAVVTTAIPGLCSRPFAEGNFTKHFHKGFNLTVRIPYWCPTWSDWGRICHKNVTLAGLSLDLNVQVGYRVTCCGAVAFGQASAQACGTLLGFTFCAGCTAKITGVAGIGRTVSGGGCTYGIGINAQLTCTFGGIKVLNLQAPFGFNVSGPCPPAGLCQ